jgi:UV DNA damage endonuclease
MDDLKFTTAGDFLRSQAPRRIGFACKYLHEDQSLSKKVLEDIQRPLNERATTITWLNNQTREVAEQRLYEIIEHNISALERLIRYVGSLQPELRMVRLGSGILPAYTHRDWSYFYRQSDLKTRFEREFKAIGDIARELDVRLSMHPGQFTVLASDRDEVVERSLEEFEYHADIIRWMGYGQNWQDFKCNVHISGKRGPAGIVDILPRLSTEARNCITIENSDTGPWGLDASLELAKDVALVLDIHHHWVHSKGEYIESDDERIGTIIDSWRGVRPVIHYSLCSETLLAAHNESVRPDYQVLLQEGHKAGKLRAHSDYCWNSACNDWALEHWQWADIMTEAKAKNLASGQLYSMTEESKRMAA